MPTRVNVLAGANAGALDYRMRNHQPTGHHPRSMTCNGELLAQLRKKRGWTQHELATRSGYTERLIGKAEAGKTVALSTIEDLAETLSEEDETVHSEDLTNDPVAKARTFIHAMYHEKHSVIEATRHFLDENVVFRIAGDPSVFPFAGTHVGIEAARQAFHAFYEVLEPPSDLSELDGFQFISTGHGALVWGKTWTHPIGHPATEPVLLAIRMDFKRGKLVLFDDCFDTQSAANAFEQVSQQQG